MGKRGKDSNARRQRKRQYKRYERQNDTPVALPDEAVPVPVETVPDCIPECSEGEGESCCPGLPAAEIPVSRPPQIQRGPTKYGFLANQLLQKRAVTCRYPFEVTSKYRAPPPSLTVANKVTGDKIAARRQLERGGRLIRAALLSPVPSPPAKKGHRRLVF